MNLDLDAITKMVNETPPDEVQLYIVDQGGVPGEGEGLPPGIAPLIPPVEPVPYNVVYDSAHELVNKAVINEGGSVTLYMHEGWTVIDLVHKAVREFMDNGLTQFTISAKTVKFQNNPLEQRTCKWFTAGKAQQEEYHTEESSEYEFDRTHRIPVCSNKNVKVYFGLDNPTCEYFQAMGKCSHYEPEGLTEQRHWVGETNNGSAVSISVSKTRRGVGTPEQHVAVTVGEDAPEAFVLDRPLEEVIEHAVEHYGLTSLEEVPPKSVEAPKEEYFQYVLSS